jgi:hypothetical protein
VVGCGIQALLVIAVCLIVISNPIPTLAHVVEQIDVLGLQGQCDFKILSSVYEVAALIKSKALLGIVLKTLLILGDAACDQNADTTNRG